MLEQFLEILSFKRIRDSGVSIQANFGNRSRESAVRYKNLFAPYPCLNTFKFFSILSLKFRIPF